MDATTVHLDGNNMSELINPGFIGRRRITTVFLNNSQIRAVTNYSLEGLTEVREIDRYLFSGHQDKYLFAATDGNIFLTTDYFQLRTLHLESNQLSELSGSEFAGLTKLRELYLHNNYLASKKTFNMRHRA